jgi:hypothetical protein
MATIMQVFFAYRCSGNRFSASTEGISGIFLLTKNNNFTIISIHARPELHINAVSYRRSYLMYIEQPIRNFMD